MRPRVDSAPECDWSDGDFATEAASELGLALDDWQSYALHRALGRVRTPAGSRWATPEVGLVVPRQNGKGAVLEARALYGLFFLDEQLLIWTAHEYKTAREAFLRVRDLIEDSPYMSEVASVRTANGEESIETVNGDRLRFLARTSGSGRGFSGDCVFLDEAYRLTGEQMAALMPTLSAKPDPQLWYASMAGMDTSETLGLVRERGRAEDERLCYLEWSADADADLDSQEQWQQANPGMPHRITPESVAQERAALPDEDFARERLCVWDASGVKSVIPADLWHSLTDRRSQVEDPVAFAVDVGPDREWCSIGVGGRREDGLAHVELVDRRKGTAWAVMRLVELAEAWKPLTVLLDPAGPAGSLIGPLLNEGLTPQQVSGREMAQACGTIYDEITNRTLRHLGQPQLNSAVDAARTRKLNDAWAWHRRDAGSDITPLVACTLALYGVGRPQRRQRSGRAVFA